MASGNLNDLFTLTARANLIAAGSNPVVTPGRDPGVHRSSKDSPEHGWMAGSRRSRPAMRRIGWCYASPKRKIPPRSGIFLLTQLLSLTLLQTSGPSGPAGPGHPGGLDPAAAGRASGRRPAAGRASDPDSDSAGPGSG